MGMDLVNKNFTNLLPNNFGTENVSLVLYSLIKTCRPKNIIEVGTGYSSLFISKAIEDIKNESFDVELQNTLTEDSAIHTNNYNPKFTIIDNFQMTTSITNTEQVLKQENLYSNITFINQDIFEFLKTNNEVFDFVWLDIGSGQEYSFLFSEFYKNLPPNGIIVIHSTLGNLAGRLFESETRLMKHYDHSFEMMSFEEPHKTIQNSFTIVKKRGDYKIYSIFA
jgi:predicted O-methyltransferase YrrM